MSTMTTLSHEINTSALTNVTWSPGNQQTGARAKDYYFVWIYISPWILIIGVTGNILTLMVMSGRRLRGSSTCVYLSALAIADSLALLFRIPHMFFEAVGLFTFNRLNRWTCRVEKFLFYTASDAAIWILVAFTMDRLIAVTLPLVKHKFCTPRRAAAVCVCIVLVAVIKNVHVFFTRGVEVTDSGAVKICGRPRPYSYFEQHVRPWLAFVLVSVLPFLIISVCNGVIIVGLLKAQRARTASLQRSGINSNSHDSERRETDKGGVRRTQILRRRSVFTQTSLMCIAASVAFVVCVTPSIVLTLGRYKWGNAGGSTQTVYFACSAAMHQLACLNHAINFFLYCVTGQRFRAELLALLRRQRSSVSEFESTTRKYYLEQAARRSTQSPTGFLAMQAVTLTAPEATVEDMDEESTDEIKDAAHTDDYGRINN